MNNPATSIRPADVAKAARKIGTPFYFYDAGVVKARYLALRGCLPERWRIYFAAKANPNLAILGIYRGLGAMVECASAGEMLAAMKAGFKGSEMALSGPVKSGREHAVLKRKKLAAIHSETETELRGLDALGARQNVALRLNVEFIRGRVVAGRIMSGGMDKFGFSPEEAAKVLLRRDGYTNIKFVGFHFYAGTQMLSARSWLDAAENYARAAAAVCRKTGFVPEYLNFGGGLGIPYRAEEREIDLDGLGRGCARLEKTLSGLEELRRAKFFVEPGRYLAGPAGAYVIKVVALKKMRGTNFAITDGGIHHALLPFRVSREFPAFLVGGRGGKKRRYVLGGPLCTTLDQSDLPIDLPRLREGDLIAIGNSGAYGYATGMHFFLSHPLPAEVLKDGGKFTLIRRPSESEHLFRLQTQLPL